MLLLWTSGALAQEASGPAELLFIEARALYTSGRIREACDKFAASQALEPAPGTQLNLASCYESLGKTATAWATYRLAAASAIERGKPQWAAAAEAGARKLEPSLARIRVVIRAPLLPTEVLLDAKRLQLGALDTALPVDPGVHEVEARREGHEPYRVSVRAEPGQLKDVQIAWTSSSASPTTSAGGSHIPAASWIFGGASVVALGVGAVFLGLRESSANALSDQKCVGALPQGTFVTCTELRDEGRTRAAIEITSFVVAGVFAAVAFSWALIANHPGTTSTKARTACLPALGGAACQGVF